MAVYGGNVLNVDATTGDYYNWYYMFSYSLVGIAYVGTQEYKYGTYDTMVDWYFVIDRMGYVYLLGFLEQDGKYYYLEHDRLAPGGIYTKLDFEMETPYYGSAYFDGEMLYYSAYKQSENKVTLMAIDVMGGTKVCYELGVFDKGVQPVAGLMELGEIENHIDWILGNQPAQAMMPTAVSEKAEPKGTRAEPSEESAIRFAAPMSVGETRDELVYVDVTLPEAGTNADMTVTFDPTMLALEDVRGNAAAFAWKAEDGQIRLSLAEVGTIRATQNVARLIFRSLTAGETTVSITTDWLSANACGRAEEIPLTLNWEPPHVHAYQAIVTAPTCTEEGYTTYICACGDSYISDKTEPLGHDWHGSDCTRCGETRNNPFTDVPEDSFYYDAVLWAVEKGITTGTTATTFDPNGQCQRAAVVTFLWRSAGCPEPTGTENPFRDVNRSDFFYEAVLWAVENGITTGMSADHFGPYALCNRAQVVTFLHRAAGSPATNLTDNPFRDVQQGDFFYEPVLWAVENAITTGVSSTSFAPDTICNRAQVVTFLYRALAE